MADGSWTLIYRTYSTPSLLAELDKLKGQKSVFASQSIGQKSYQKDLRELKLQMEACVFVLNERGQRINTDYGTVITDFSQVDGSGSANPPSNFL